MGTIRNEMTIVHDWDKNRIEKLRQDAIQTFSKSIEDMISPIMTSHINEEYTFIINGDCSKLGWETSKRFHDIRMKWCEDHKHDAESIVVINFGEDGPCYIVYDNNGEESLDYKKVAKSNYNKNIEELACYTCIYAPYAPACNNCLFDSNYIRRIKNECETEGKTL